MVPRERASEQLRRKPRDFGAQKASAMSSTNQVLTQAFSQWSLRPADQRFSSITALRDACNVYRVEAQEARGIALDSLRVEKQDTELVLLGRTNVPVSFTHWSFGQLCSEVGAPAGFLRELPPTLAAMNLNHKLSIADPQASRKLLFRQNGVRQLRAITGNDYGRVWNVDVVDRVIEMTQRNPAWQPAPAAFDGSRGLYASDHDLFMFMVDNNRRIFEKQEGGLSRGFFVDNSETGAGAIGVTTFFYEWVCGNHRVWGASDVRTFRISHFKNAEDKSFRAIERSLRAYVESSATEDEARIGRMHTFELGTTKEEVVEKVFGMKGRPQVLTMSMIEKSFDRAEERRDRYGAPTTVWGLTGGMTELARDLPHADERVKLDRAASKVMRIAF